MRRLMIALLIGLLGVVTGCSAAESTEQPVQAKPGSADAVVPAVRQLDPTAFATEIDHGRSTINVHVPNEGALAGTDLTLPFDEIQQRAGELPQDLDTPLAIYCMTDHMSGIAGQTLTELGYTDIVELDGGMQAWQADGRLLLPA